MSSRHHKRRGENLPVPVQRRVLRLQKEERGDKMKKGSDEPESAKETADGVAELADYLRRLRTLDVGAQLPPKVQQAIDGIADPKDTILQRILNAAYRYDTIVRRRGKMTLELPPPTIKEGISFYIVGHNASHEFYLGMKDGKIYRMSIGEGFPPDGDWSNIPVECKITEISEEDLGNTYIGHF